ncbi:MAG: hypothetical protein KDD82_27640 [Planctomycetes bacterium]|nr:hypothetical protein [Planctomycetota bacterium]
MSLFLAPAPTLAFAATFFDLEQVRSPDGASTTWAATFSLELGADQGGTASTRVTVTSPSGASYSGALVDGAFAARVAAGQPNLASLQAALGDGTWRLQLDLDGDGAVDGVYALTLTSSALDGGQWHGLPAITAPADGSFLDTSTPVFQWTTGPLATTGDFNNVFADLYAADGNDQFGTNLPFFGPDVLMDFELDRAITFPGALAPGLTTFQIYYSSQWLDHPGAGLVTKVSGVDVDFRNFGQAEPKPTLILGSYQSIDFVVAGELDLSLPAGVGAAITELLEGLGYPRRVVWSITHHLVRAQRHYDRYESALDRGRFEQARRALEAAQVQVVGAILAAEYLGWFEVGVLPPATTDAIVELCGDLIDRLQDLHDAVPPGRG